MKVDEEFGGDAGNRHDVVLRSDGSGDPDVLVASQL